MTILARGDLTDAEWRIMEALLADNQIADSGVSERVAVFQQVGVYEDRGT